MAKRGRKPKSPKLDYNYYDDGPVKDNFLDAEEELVNRLDTSEIERYIQPYRKYDRVKNHEEEDSFAYWYGQN